MTEKEAIQYLKKVLKWQAFIQSHKKIKRAIECLLIKKENLKTLRPIFGRTSPHPKTQPTADSGRL